jgi:D-glycero-D-manno-heptose 1,7-bisphosphate phosphatase
MTNLIILDRDGVINEDSDNYIKHPDEWHPIPGSLEAIAQLKQAGFQIAIATNQSGINRGLYSLEILEKIHEKLHTLLKNDYGTTIDYIAFCPHTPTDNCSCRKPKPGLLLEIAKHFQCDLKNVPFVGDKFSDLETANQAGCLGVLVRTGYGEETLAAHPDLNVPCYDNLKSFAEAYLENYRY